MNKNIEFKANQLLDATGCGGLPVDIGELARRSGYNVKSYSACKTLIRKLSAEDIIKQYPSVSFKFDGAYYILLSDNLTRDEERKLIAHEIGHIQLHGLNSFDISHSHEVLLHTKTQETEADMFALYLLAPVALLGQRKIKDPSCIKELTGLSLKDCKIVFENMQEYFNERCVANSRRRLLESNKNCKLKLLKPYFVFACLCLLVLILSLYIKPNIKATQTVSQNTFLSSTSNEIFDSNHSEQIQNSSSLSHVEESKIDLSDISSISTTATYYWTDSGTVYHYFKDCQSLKNSTKIRSGSLSMAKASKSRLCKFCENKLH